MAKIIEKKILDTPVYSGAAIIYDNDPNQIQINVKPKPGADIADAYIALNLDFEDAVWESYKKANPKSFANVGKDPFEGMRVRTKLKLVQMMDGFYPWMWQKAGSETVTEEEDFALSNLFPAMLKLWKMGFEVGPKKVYKELIDVASTIDYKSAQSAINAQYEAICKYAESYRH